ncbi:hypothetical protein ACIA5G_14900 [Amycolatopsis sp. NPDC051758]|uniref:hypothetical protein n=1 Tax=Amycolatopsis sp. NPDC051758 TaxID=3363935 RepID=UPI0037AED96C
MAKFKGNGSQALAVAAVVLGIVSGILGNLLTQQWGWGLAAGLATVAAAWAAVEWRRARTVGRTAGGPRVEVTARRGGVIRRSGTRVRQGSTTTVLKVASGLGRIENSPVEVTGPADVRQKAGKNALISDSETHIE